MAQRGFHLLQGLFQIQIGSARQYSRDSAHISLPLAVRATAGTGDGNVLL